MRPLLLNSRSKTPGKVILAEKDHVITDSRLVAECLNSYFADAVNHDTGVLETGDLSIHSSVMWV